MSETWISEVPVGGPCWDEQGRLVTDEDLEQSELARLGLASLVGWFEKEEGS